MKNKILASLSAVLLIFMTALGSPSLASASEDAADGGTMLAVLISITVSPVNPSVVSGQTEQFTAQGLDQDGSVMTLVAFIWGIASSQSDAGTIDSSTGVFTAGTTPGTYTDAIEVKYDTVTGTVSVTVTPSTLGITTVSLVDGQEDVDYSQTLVATGGSSPYTWSITTGSLPDGLSLSGDTISGTPTTAGTYNFTANVIDSTSPAPNTVTMDLSITISPAAPAISDNITEITPDNTTEITSDNITEITPDNITEITSDNITEITSDNTTEITLDNTTEITSDNTTEITSDNTTEITSDDATEITSFIIRLVAGLSVAAQQQVIARDGGVETSSVLVLNMHFIKVPNASVDGVVQRYKSDPEVRSIEYDTVRNVGETSSDPSYPDQWALPKISWDSVFGSVIPTGSSVIAILDTGIDASHPDLSGLVLSGYSAFEGSDAQTDPNGHGTKMAGITAALTNNGIGVAGVAYAGVSLLPIQVLGTDGTGQDSDIINGIVWAVDYGANVILMAFSNPDYSPALQEAIDYAWDHGVTLVAAAGNDGLNTVTYPAGDRGVIGVSATDPDDALVSSSNYGQLVFLAAPGMNLLTTDLNSDYTAVSGTSAAAAVVAGAAAFMRAVDPILSNGVIVGRLARAADPVGTQEQTGNGRLNMARAISDTGTAPVQPTGASPLGDGGPYIGPYTAAAAITSTGTGGNWSAGGTWVGGIAPVAGDTVTIVGGATVTVDVANAACTTLTIGSSYNSAATLSFNSGSVLTVSSTLTLGASGGQRKGSVNMASGGTLKLGAGVTVTNGGTWTPGTGTVEYYAVGAQTVNGSFFTSYYNLTLSGSGAKTTTGVTVNGILSMEGTATASAAPTYGAAATLRYNTATGRTVGAEWITPFAATGGVIVANTGTITLNAAKVFNASVPLTINSGATLATGNYQLTFGGNFVNNGGTFTAGSSAMVITNTAATQSIAGFTTTGNVSLTKTGGTATFTGNVNGGALTINGLGGTLNLGTGLTHTFTSIWMRTAGTLDGGSSTLKIGGSVSGTGGTFTASTGTVEWNAAGAQTTAGVTYNNLTLSGSGVKTMTGITTIGGDLTISGTATMTGNAGFTVTGALNYGSSGTTNLTASTPISIGTFIQTAGTLVDNGNTLTVTGTGANTWTKSGGTFTATGTATFTGVAPQIGASNFKNLTINIGSGNTVTITGVITVSGILTINSGTTLADGGFVVTANGNVANSGTHSGAGKITLAGGAALHSLSGSGTYGNLELNDSNGASLTASPTINGALTLTSGALSIGANTLTLNGAVSTTSGSLTGGASSNIIFGGSGASTTLPVVTLNNLTINRANGISLGGAVTVGGTFTLTSGTFAVGANTLTLNGPTIAGTSANLATTSSSSLSFGGSSAGVNIPSSVTALNNLTINNSNGITLNNNPTINGTLTFTLGNLLASSNTVIIPAGGTVSRTSGYVIGNLQKNVAMGATSRTFEVGTASAYNPVTVAFGNVTTAGNLIVKVTSGQHPNIGTSTISSSKNVNEYWSLTNSGVVFNNYSATFTFVAGDILGGANPSNFIIGDYSSGWTYPNVGTKTATSTQATGITSFGDFCIGELRIPPTINSVILVDASMTPQIQQTVTINVSNADGGKAALSTLVLKLWYDSSGSDYSESTFDSATADTQNCAIITWTQSTDSFVIQPSSSTTWALGTCSSPGSLPGDFTFRFTVGKVATATSGSARWQVAAKVSNNVGQTGFNYDSTPPNMDWYGEITVNTVNITWVSTVALGSGFTDDIANRITNISLTYICNGNYNMQAEASSPWSSGEKSVVLATTDTPGNGEIALKADDDATLNGAVLILSTGYTTFGTGTQTSESGNTVTNNSLWLKLGASGIPDVQYSGTIYYRITP